MARDRAQLLITISLLALFAAGVVTLFVPELRSPGAPPARGRGGAQVPREAP